MKMLFAVIMLASTLTTFAAHTEKLTQVGTYENIMSTRNDLKEIESVESLAVIQLTKECLNKQVGNVQFEDVKLENFRLVIRDLKMRRKFSKDFGLICTAITIPSLTPRYKYTIEYSASAKCVIQ